MPFSTPGRGLTFPLDVGDSATAKGQGGAFAVRPKPSHEGEAAGRAKREAMAKQQHDAALDQGR